MISKELRSLLYLKSPDIEDQVSPLISRGGWNISVASHPEAAVDLMKHQEFRVGLVHYDCTDSSSISLDRQIEQLLDANSHINWIALLKCGSQSLADMCRLIATYFYDYHTLPVDPERLLFAVGHAHGMAEIAKTNASLRGDDLSQFGIVGQGPAMSGLFEAIAKFAAIDLNVMIRGESGTGKELTAHAIHRLSRRSSGPFVAVNCGALPKDLIQAELFGHEKGSFTGADRRRLGRIEAAQSGTLFLDEIGDLPLDLQVNLLRFLQERTIDRIGGSAEIPVDVRVIAATNVDLERAVEEGRFREDLYYRLNVLHMDVPPLRERGDDIERLAYHFFDQFAKGVNPNLRGFSKLALTAIKEHPWPGNVRELGNRIQRAVVMCEDRLIKPRDLGLDKEAPNCNLMTLAEARAKAEKESIEATLAAVRNNVSKAARRLNISRVTLYRLMEQHSIDWQRDRSS